MVQFVTTFAHRYVFGPPRAQRTSYQELVRNLKWKLCQFHDLWRGTHYRLTSTTSLKQKPFKRLLKTFLILRFRHRVTFINCVIRYWTIFILYFSVN